MLDYGSGTGRLKDSLGQYLSSPVEITEYDPAIEGKDIPPNPCDLVVCLDVLSCVEPEKLDAVLDDLYRTVTKFFFISIPELKSPVLRDSGQNAHKIIEELPWWLPRLWDRFSIHSLCRVENGFWLIGMRNGDYDSRRITDSDQ